MQEMQTILSHSPRQSVQVKSKFEGIGLIQEILCINCQEMVSLGRISDHSFRCTRVTMEVKAMEAQSNELEAVKFRIRKLSDHFRRSKTSHILSPSDRNVLGVACKLSERLLGEEPLQGVKFVVESLDKVMEGFKGALSVLINLERLRALANEVKGVCLSQELLATNQEIESLRAALDVEVHRASSISQMHPVSLEDINSSVRSHSSSAQSSSRGGEAQFDVMEELQIDVATELENAADSPEEAKRQFYALSLEVKLGMRAKSKGLRVSVPLLYDKAVREKVPQSNWKEFIKESMENPDPDLMQSSKKNPKFAANQLDTRFNYSDSVISESEAATELD